MRIKINDKIYRLKEIESGVDSLMELVEGPKYKFKMGDKVRIKDGISSKTVHGNHPSFHPSMDDLIGKTMTIDGCVDGDYYVVFEGIYWAFREDWLEPYEELKKGDLAIFWDDMKEQAFIHVFNKFTSHSDLLPYTDMSGLRWKNAIKYESKEEFERFIKGEI